MTRPLVICDCDEVLLHMVSHFGAWLDEEHDIVFSPQGGDFSRMLKRREDGGALTRDETWPLLNAFFETEMGRQTPVPGATEALVEISEHAEIVILTNLQDEFRDARAAQLHAFGINFPVHTNQGGKGEKVAELVGAHRPPLAVFVDDLWIHHQSVAKRVPDVWRLHMIAEPEIADRAPPADDAHARIDDWHEARGWIIDRITEGVTA